MLSTSEAGRLWEVMGDTRARLRAVEREMRDRKRKAGIPLWGHIAAMATISGLSALGLIKPETALSMLRMLGKVVAG